MAHGAKRSPNKMGSSALLRLDRIRARYDRNRAQTAGIYLKLRCGCNPRLRTTFVTIGRSSVACLARVLSAMESVVASEDLADILLGFVPTGGRRRCAPRARANKW